MDGSSSCFRSRRNSIETATARVIYAVLTLPIAMLAIAFLLNAYSTVATMNPAIEGGERFIAIMLRMFSLPEGALCWVAAGAVLACAGALGYCTIRLLWVVVFGRD